MAVSYTHLDVYKRQAVKYVNPQWTEIGNNMSAMFLGEMTPEEVLEDLDKNRAEQAKAASDEAWN